MTEHPPTRRRTLLLVAGPGRSGTSLVTGLIGRLGYHIPQPEIGATDANPRGFGESRWSLAFHKRLMDIAGVTNGDTRPEAADLVARASARAPLRQELSQWLLGHFALSDRVVVKDPRLVWFVDLYRRVATELGADFGVLTMLRHPAEAVRSADMAFGGLDASTRTTGWINSALTVERTTRGIPRAFVNHDELMNDWRKALDMAERDLSMKVLSAARSDQIADAEQLVDASLRRSRAEWADLGAPANLQRTAMHTWDALTALVIDDDTGAGAASVELDRIWDGFVADYHTATGMVYSTIHAARVTERQRIRAEVEQEAAEAARAQESLAVPANSPLLRRIARRLTPHR